MRKGKISLLLRQFRFIYLADIIRYFIEKLKNRKINKDFKKRNPDVKLPMDYLIYESFQINYKKYFLESIDTAKWVSTHLAKHIELKNIKILDWGCGPGRVIRHLPMVIGNGCEYYGTDYNIKSIKWCSENLPYIEFNTNTLEAKLPYSDNFFDVIYGISVLTHLSERLHYNWYKELYRILKPNGIIFLTTQGDNFKIKLTKSELIKYENGDLIVRGKTKEGHRTFSTFHPTKFMKKLFANVEILEHIVNNPEKECYLPQDIWIIKKNQ